MYHKTYPDRVEDEGDARWAGPEGVRAVGRLCWQRRAKMQAGKGKEDRDGWWDKLGLMESREFVILSPCLSKFTDRHYFAFIFMLLQTSNRHLKKTS